MLNKEEEKVHLTQSVVDMNLGFTRLPFEIDTCVPVYIVPCQSNNEAKQ